jgi:DNA-binding transcriptional LysR family regulator
MCAKKRQKRSDEQIRWDMGTPLPIEDLQFWVLFSQALDKHGAIKKCNIEMRGGGSTEVGTDLSTRVAKIGAVLGTQLIQKNRAGATLTADGRLLAARAQEILAAYGTLLMTTSSNHLVVGATTTLLLDFVSYFLEKSGFLQKFTGKRLHFITDTWPNLYAAVIRGDVHVSIAPSVMVKDCKSDVLYERGWVIAYHANNPIGKSLVALDASGDLNEQYLPEALKRAWVCVLPTNTQPDMDMLSLLRARNPEQRIIVVPTFHFCWEYVRRNLAVAVMPDPRVYDLDTTDIRFLDLPDWGTASVSAYLPNAATRFSTQFVAELKTFAKTLRVRPKS